MTGLQRGDRAPLLFGLTLNGEPYLEEPQGSWLILAFFKESCPTCRLILPRLEALHRAYPLPGWRLMGIGQDPPETLRKLTEELGLSFPILADRDFASSTAYRLTHVPTLFLIEPDGRIAHILVGFARDDLEALSRMIAQRLHVPPHPITQDGDPAFRPG